jgi:hypothetical protein
VTEPTTDGPADDGETPDLPNPQTGIGIGAGRPSSFEPEEDDPDDDETV